MRVRESHRIRGLVQGVGFRPTVWRTARRLGLGGCVWNDAEGVVAVVEGEESAVAAFPEALRGDVAREAPLARIDEFFSLGLSAPEGTEDFTIAESRDGVAHTMVTPDAATCPECMRDMFDPENRRWRYAFTNCTHCGPRFTITLSIPYDRAQTAMRDFAMCRECQAEYDDPADRRFHAQPNACPVCGPQLLATNAAGGLLPGDPVRAALEEILAGRIVAVKGLGGFHLVCDAGNEEAVARLRARKGRSEKALAVMVANESSARRVTRLSPAGLRALRSVARPIVLAPRAKGIVEAAEAAKDGEPLIRIAPSVAPGFTELGVMIPYAPVQLLLFHEFLGRPAGGIPDAPVPLALVMTSANPGGEPLVTDNVEALRRLGGIADAFLMNNRDIVARCDDSVVRDFGDCVRMVRRARGFTPLALPVPEGPDVIAFGPLMKNTATVTRGAEAFLTEHIGDVENESTERALIHSTNHFLDILEVEPEAVACDLHPDFPTTRLAEMFAMRRGIPLERVQHHHAHVAAVQWERGLSDRTVWGIALDGVGLGADGAAWGGELLLVHPDGEFERRGHLAELALPGMDRAAREPRRMGAAAAVAAGRGDAIERLWPAFEGQPIRELIASPRLSGRTTSLGRLFDAAAAVLGLVEVMRDEAHAATMLESAGSGFEGRVVPGGWRIEGREGEILSFAPLMAHLIDARLSEGFCAGRCAADFEATVTQGIALWADGLMGGSKDPVCLAGGCFLNRMLATRIPQILAERGRRALLPEALPPGDGAVSFGEAAVLRARLAARAERARGSRRAESRGRPRQKTGQ